MTRWILIAVLFVGCVAVPAVAEEDKGETVENPIAIIKTSMGEIWIELNAEKAPISVANFLQYVDDGHYDGTIFHRVIKGFMIQGGGFSSDMVQKPTRDPIKNEASNGLTNQLGTIAMARTEIVDSATSQFFINTKNNTSLNHRGEASYGYAVFGRVVDGMDVVQAIEATRTGVKDRFRDVPVVTVMIASVSRK